MIDSSPPPLLPTAGYFNEYDDGSYANDDDRENEEYSRGRVSYERDSEIDKDGLVQETSPSQGEAESDGEGHNRSGERRAKRRRISVSPFGVGIEEPCSPPDIGREMDVEMGDPLLDPETSFSEPSIAEDDLDSDREAAEDDTENIGGSSPPLPPLSSPSPHLRQEKKAHQPTFQRAPRFKPAEIPEGAPRPEPLPDVFSPRRKGVKYIQGGLAAELRDWLVDVEAGIGSGSGSTTAPGANKHDGEWIARIRVDSLRGAHGNARGMTLVIGRQVLDRRINAIGAEDSGRRDASEEKGDGEGEGEALGTNTVRLILAGPGRLSGLGVGHDVRPGVVLGIARPTWEVVLDGLGRWGVACDWVVLR